MHQLRIVGQIQGSLGEESEGVTVLLLPLDDLLQDRRDGTLIADQVVVDNKGHLQLRAPQGLQLRDDLLAGLQARAAAKGDDDVAELALKGAASGDLQAAEHIMLCFKLIVARAGEGRHVGAI